MGRVTLEARRFAVPESPVTWRIFYQRHVREAGCATLVDFAAKLRAAHPLIREGPRLLSGAVCLNDPATAASFLGVLFAGESALPGVPTERGIEQGKPE
jgi:hypothetical protein